MDASNLGIAYSFKTHYCFITGCTLIAQMARLMLSRVTCALLKLLVQVVFGFAFDSFTKTALIAICKSSSA